MKKIAFTSLFLVIAMSVHSCSQETIISNDDGITTLWSSATSDTKSYGPDSAEAHVTAIQGINVKHPIAQNFLAELEKYGYKKCDLDLDNITRTIMTKSSAVALSVPNKVNGEMIMAYLYENTYCVVIGTRDGDVATFRTVDGVSFASFTHNDNSVLVSKANNRLIDQFSSIVYNIEPQNKEIMTRGNKLEAECCRRASNWSNCMSCTAGAMGFWGYVFSAYSWQFAVAVGGSCIGAGPRAWC
ncbi:MAG: hypothetical protein LBR57_00130 [Alistipes sp.]|nr:hypothetical protein [Alistipes sp.]